MAAKILLGLLAAVALPLLASASDKFAPVEKLDEAAYLGTWFQAYGSASVVYTFQLGGNCVTATYSKTEDKTKIKVDNRARPFADYFGDDSGDSWYGDVLRDCSVLLVQGFVAQSNVTDGAFTVKLQPGPIPLGIGTPNIKDVEFEPDGNYWILELGPIENDQYQWVILTNGPDKVQLYVLVRNVAQFEELYEAEVLAKVKNYGFTTFTNRPRKTNQENCGYEFEDWYHEDEYYNDDDYESDSKDRRL